ncbi:MAG: dicarboxylate/amino acid:cation symporter [Planctomycetes bacterium]|nr:dicarboxylate/amino acid:cation symporter [Planctomycetota bacterium]
MAGSGHDDGERSTLDGDDAGSGSHDRGPAADAVPPAAPRGPAASAILLGIALGMILGLLANAWQRQAGGAPGIVAAARAVADVVGNLFLRLIFVVVLPLVISALALAVVEMGDLRKLGRIGIRTLFVSALLSAAAVAVGLLLVNAIRPGAALAATSRDELLARETRAAEGLLAGTAAAKPLTQVLIDLLPHNPLQEMVGAIDGSSKGNGMLAVMVFSLLLGAAIAARPDRCGPLVAWLEAWHSVAMTVIGWALSLTPIGAGCLVFAVASRVGFDVVVALFWFAVTVLLGLTIQLVVVYPLVLRLLGGRSPAAFFRAAAPALEVAFGTSSSNATLPTALQVAEHDLLLPRDTSRFVLTVGATANQNGTALYEGVVVLFLAQAFGVELSVGQQAQVVLMSILAGIGTAGVPGGSLPLIAVLARSVGVPGEGIGIIFGVDRLLDMCRTVLNVAGDLVVAVCVAAGHSGGNEPHDATRH